VQGVWIRDRVTANQVRCSDRACRGEYAVCISESPLNFGEGVEDHQVIIRAGQVEAVVVPLDEYRALKALEQREAELYWAVHEARYPSRRGDDLPGGKVYESMDELLADLDFPE
jgi:hypothetical protein